MPDILPTGTTESPVTVIVSEMPAGGASLTDAELRADPLHVIVDAMPESGGGLTDQELRASPVAVSGAVAVSNLPATQAVSGTVTVANPVTSVSVSNLPVTQPVSGTVAVSNHPSSVQVSNFPASQAVTGTFWQATQPVSGSVSVSNFPATQPVSIAGTVSTTQGAPALTIRHGTRAAAPLANAVLATTGPLAAGSYRVDWNCVAMDTIAVGKGCIVEHRNAADNANIAVLGGCAAGESQSDEEIRVVVATNERIRITTGSAAGAASSLYAGHLAVYPA